MSEFFLMDWKQQLMIAIFVLLAIAIVAGALYLCVQGVVKVIGRTGIHVGGKKGGVSIPAPSDDADGLGVIAAIPMDKFPVGMENNLISLVLRVQFLYSQYSDLEKNHYDILLSEQIEKLKAELKNFTNEIKTEYDAFIRKDNSNDYTTQSYIFDSWIREQVKSIKDNLIYIIKRNHLRQKQTEEFEDTVRSVIDTTYADLKSSALRAPEFIKYKRELAGIFTKCGESYRHYIEIVLQFAKRESVKTAEELEIEKKKLKEDIIVTVERFFPGVDKKSIMDGLA